MSWGTLRFALVAACFATWLTIDSTAAAPMASGSCGSTEWSGAVTLSADCTVAAGTTLTIDAGTTITFSGNFGLYVARSPGSGQAGGTLLANGTSANPIVFEGTGGSNSGQWKGIGFGTGSSGSLSNVQILNAGGCCLNPPEGGSYSSAFLALGSSPTLTNVTISNSADNAVEVHNGGNPTLTNDTFTNNAGWAVIYDADGVTLPTSFSQDQNLVATGNGTNAVGLPGGTLSGQASWSQTSLGIPLIVNSNLNVAAGASFTLAAGSALEFAQSFGLYANVTSGSTAGGVLSLVGTASQPISLSGTSHTAGFWKGVGFSSGSGGTLSNVHLSDAGYCCLNPIEGGSFQDGIAVLDASPTISNTTVDDLPGGIDALAVRDNQGFPTLQNDTFVGDDILVSPDGLNLLSNVTLQGSGLTIDVLGGTLALNDTWPNAGTPYRVLSNLVVPVGLALTIPQPITTTINCNCGLYVQGTLTVTGTVSSPVVFQGAGSGSGQWKGITYQTGSQGGLSYTTLEDPGGCCLNPVGGGSYNSALLALGSSPTFDHVTIDHSSDNAVEVSGGGNPTLTNDTFTNNGPNNGGWAVIYDSGSLPASFIQDHNLVATGNTNNAVGFPAGTLSGQGAWDQASLGIPIILNGDVAVGSGSTLALGAGSTFLVSGNFGFYVHGPSTSPTALPGALLLAQGTVNAPITFNGTVAAPGSWKGLAFEPGSGGRWTTSKF